MAINTDISDLAWLTHPADPGASLARGAAVGSQIAQNYLHGVGLAQQAMANEVQQRQNEQRLAMEIAQFPLQQTIRRQNADLNALNIQNGLQARQNYLEASKAFTGLADSVNSNLQEGNLDEAILAFTQGGLSNNALLTDPRYQALGKQLDLMQREADLAEYRKGTVEARMMERDKGIREASRVGELTKQLRESQAKTLEPDEGNPEYRAELTKQEAIRAELSALQKNTANVTPELKIIEGKKFLVNPKTGAVHEISKTVGKREFIAEHVASWIRDNPGMSQDEAGAAMGAFYDKYIGEATGAPQSPSVATPATVPSYRYNPSSGRIEPIK